MDFLFNDNDIFIISVPALEELVLHICLWRPHSFCRLPSKNHGSAVLLQLLLLCRLLALEKACKSLQSMRKITFIWHWELLHGKLAMYIHINTHTHIQNSVYTYRAAFMEGRNPIYSSLEFNYTATPL